MHAAELGVFGQKQSRTQVRQDSLSGEKRTFGMQRTWKTVTTGVALTIALSASAALAAQNVANASQKGSLLMFPLIDVSSGYRTVIRIANDAGAGISVKCYYMNQTKGRNDFVFRLTPKQAATWDVRSGAGDPTSVNPFPVGFDDGYGGSTEIGELICFAVNLSGEAQVAWNHLSGTATVYHIDDSENANAYEYNSWNFTARTTVNNNSRPFGVAGQLDLSGTDGPGQYDACPLYNIAHFTPTDIRGSGNSTRIGVSSCFQDLRQDYTPTFTKLNLPVWNAQEVAFTGAYECADSTHSFELSVRDIDKGGANTSYQALGTETAQMQIRGVASSQCAPLITVATGLVAVAVSSSSAGATAVTTNHAGVSPVIGSVKWDPFDTTPTSPSSR